MTAVLNTLPFDKLTSKPRPVSRLTITRRDRREANDPKFNYVFSTMEFVVTDLMNPGLIELQLDTANLPQGVAEMYIHDYCCTRGDSMEPAAFRDARGQEVQGFGPRTVYVALRPKLRSKELVDVGLLVAIREQNANEYDLILCDPQVGNGPPVTYKPGEAFGALSLT